MGCGILYRMVAERIGLSATLATRRTIKIHLWDCDDERGKNKEVRRRCARMQASAQQKILATFSASLVMRSMKSHTHFRRIFGLMAPFDPPTAEQPGASLG